MFHRKGSWAVCTLAALVFMPGCRLPLVSFFDGIKGSGRIVEETRPAGDFSGIEVHGALDAHYTPGDQVIVTLKGDDNLLPFITTEVRDGKLVVEVESGKNISPTKSIRLTVSAPAVASFEAHGASTLVATRGNAEKVVAAAHGASTVNVAAVEARELVAEAHGASSLIVAGAAERAELQAHGASTVGAAGLKANTAQVDASGHSTIQVAASQEVVGDASGASSVVIEGQTARRDVRTSGASSVRQK